MPQSQSGTEHAMATIRRRNGKWQVQVRRSGQGSISRTFTQKSDAQAWARQMEIQADKGELTTQTTDTNQLTFSYLIIRYRDEVASRKRGHRSEVFYLNSLLRHPISQTLLNCLSTDKLCAYRDERARHLKPSSLKRRFAVLHNCFEVAIREWGIALPRNPVSSIKLPTGNVSRERRLKTGERMLIEDALNTPSAAYLRPLVTMAIETGMRKGELLSIRWIDVDFDARTVEILRTKNGHPGTVPLTPLAIQTLSAMKQAAERVFPISDNAVRFAWERMRKRAGIPDLRFHDLRHEGISRLFEAGLNVPEVAMVSGHRSPAMLFRYTHPKPEHVAAKLAMRDARGLNRGISSGAPETPADDAP